MNDAKKQKWNNLLKQLTIDKSWSKVASPDYFASLGQKLDIKFPEDYQYFCQVLGSGSPDNYLRLYCLDEDIILEGRDTAEYMIERINYGIEQIASMTPLEMEEEGYDPDRRDDESYIELLKSSLIFGDCNSERVMFWDLRTYSSSDDSYDIYWHSQDVPEYDIPIKIGRDFTDFLCEFLYGQLPCQLIPEVFPESPRQIKYNFNCG
jgi:SMI1 / KNR4 family (SUKH-1)